jgi:hypothetical protein
MEKYKPRKLEKGTYHKRETSLDTGKLTKQALGAVIGLNVVGAAVNLLKK